MPLGKKWRSMDVLHFGSSKRDHDSLKKHNAFMGSRDNLSQSVRSRASRSREDLLDHNHNDRSRTGSRNNLEVADPRIRLGSLSNVKEREDTGAKQDDSSSSDKEGYIQRCVIIQRDEKGYGLTVRGDNPVYVESVKPDGAAARAGVQQGDRICKVNGTLVTNSNHIEVVKLIKSGSFVALTLMNKVQGAPPTDKPPGEAPPSGVTLRDRVTAPIPVDERKSVELNFAKYNELKKYLDIAVEDLNITRQKYNQNPTDRLQKDVQNKEKTVKKLEEQLKVLSSTLSHDCQEQSVSPPFSHTDSAEQSQDASVTPWQRDGPRHFKSGSHPVCMYPTNKPVVTDRRGITRSQSDASTRLAPSVYRQELQLHLRTADISPEHIKAHEKRKTFNRKAFRKSSIPTAVSDGSSSTESPSTSPNTSPTPTHPNNAETEDTSSRKRDSGYIDDTSHSSHTQSSKANQEIIAMDEDEFSDEDQSNTIIPDSPLDCEFPTLKMENTRKSSAPVSPFLARLQNAESSDYGPFNDLRSVENKPAHMAVFLNFTLQNDSAAPVLFYITSNLYQQAKGGCKELQKWAFEIHSTFLVYGAPLKIDKVTDAVVSEIDNVLNTKYDKEDALRCIFQQARNIVQQVVDKLLEEFRAKRDLGFWNLYGAQHLRDNMKLKEEMDVVNRVLGDHLENAQSESDDAKPDRNIAIAWALATFIRGVSQQDKRHNSSLDRIQSFIAKDKKSLLMKPSSLSKKRVVKDHQFILQHFVRVEYCLYCNKPLWGIGYQGYQCQICEQSVHKQCIDKIEDPCTKRKRRPPSGIPGRRTQGGLAKLALPDLWSSWGGNSGRNSVSMNVRLFDSSWGGTWGGASVPTVNEDASSPGPNTSGNSFVISNLKDRPDEDMERTHSVSSIISRFDPKSMQNDRKKSPSAEESQRKGAEIGRSESLKGRHDKGGRPTRRAKSDIDKDESLMQVLNPSGSSSNSSLRSGESPSNSMDAVNSIPHTIENDSDFEIEPELPTLYSIFDKDVYKKMKPKEKKRQEVINELFYTEKSHVRNLKIMLNLFYKPMSMEANYADLLRTIFPNLEEMIALHGSLNSSMKFRRKENPVVSEVGDLLLKRFDGDDGQTFKKGCALCCRNQSYALDLLKARQRKDTRLANFLNEAESSSLMKKLQLKDFIPKQMMRLTKYPLLIESLLRYTQTSTEEHSRLERALQCSKHILEYVNQAVKDFENQYTLEQLQRKIDKRQLDSENEELRSLHLPSHRLVHEGSLTWNINQRKTVDVHVVLLEDLLVLLQKSDEKYLLKFQSTQLVAGKDDSRFMFSPVLNLKNVLHTNHKATDKRSFFVVSKSQIYELSAHTAEEQRKWIKYIKEAADTFKRADKAVEEKPAASQIISEQKSQLHGIHRPGADDLAHPRVDIVTQEPDLIPPTEVTISDVLTVKPEPVLHPLEKMKRLDEEMKESVEEKKLLTAQVLDIPASEIPQRVQMAVEQDSTSDISDLLLAMAHESGDCLTSLNAAESGLAEADLKMPIPMDKLKEMANRMNQILTNLLAVVSNRDEERERLRIELKAAQDELNYLREIQRRVTSSSPNPASKTTERPQSMISEASSSLSEPEMEARNLPDDETQEEETSDQNEEDIPEEDVEEEEMAEEEESDSEYSEPEMSTPTDLPTVLSDIPSEPLCEVAPPTGEEVEEGKPLALAPDELIHVEEVQEAEINHLTDLTEQVSEIQDAKEIMESESRNGNDTESEIRKENLDIGDRRESDADYKDAPGEEMDLSDSKITDVDSKESESESKEDKSENESKEEGENERKQDETENEGSSVDPNSDSVNNEVKVESENKNDEKCDDVSEKKLSDEQSEGSERTKDKCEDSDVSGTEVSRDDKASDAIDKDTKIVDANSNENVIDSTSKVDEPLQQKEEMTSGDT